MTGYREILRLSAQGISQRSIANSCQCSRNTVAKVLRQAGQEGMEWGKVRDLTDGELCNRLFPNQIQPSSRKLPVRLKDKSDDAHQSQAGRSN
jgi:hypothetical protein